MALCWHQVAVSEAPAESRAKHHTPPGLHKPDAVAGMKEKTALHTYRDRGGGTVSCWTALKALGVDHI